MLILRNMNIFLYVIVWQLFIHYYSNAIELSYESVTYLNQSMHATIPPDVEQMVQFLDHMMNPVNRSNLLYVIVDKKPPLSGFASQFQMMAKDWMKAAAGVNYSMPVFIRNSFALYTQSEECRPYAHQVTCFFLPLSEYQDEIIKKGTRVSHGNPRSLDESIIPPLFKPIGFQRWWGIIQMWMFRLQPKVLDYVMNKAKMMKFPFDNPLVGIHVRHGDKGSDGWKEHSYEEQIQIITHSPDCVYHNGTKCYTSNSTSGTSSSTSSSSSEGMELKIFVASDDKKVLDLAKSKGDFTVPVDDGISQNTGKSGMAAVLANHAEKGYNASLEIISDIFFLSHCSTLIGLASSQVFRMSVGIANATGRLRYAAAVDYDQIDIVRRMSKQCGVIFTETFSTPKYAV